MSCSCPTPKSSTMKSTGHHTSSTSAPWRMQKLLGLIEMTCFLSLYLYCLLKKGLSYKLTRMDYLLWKVMVSWRLQKERNFLNAPVKCPITQNSCNRYFPRLRWSGHALKCRLSLSRQSNLFLVKKFCTSSQTI